MRSKLRGWWRYSRLNGPALAVLVVATGGVAAAATAVVTVWMAVVAGVLAAALTGLLARGAWRAERARRFGCW